VIPSNNPFKFSFNRSEDHAIDKDKTTGFARPIGQLEVGHMPASKPSNSHQPIMSLELTRGNKLEIIHPTHMVHKNVI
jgi:hypothetical protein